MAALSAAEATGEELGADVGGSGNGAHYGADVTDFVRSEGADGHYFGEVVDGDEELVAAALDVGGVEGFGELSQALAEERGEAVELHLEGLGEGGAKNELELNWFCVCAVVV